MFFRKRAALLIGKNFIYPGIIALGKPDYFAPLGEVLPYTAETLPSVLGSIREKIGAKKVRVVLADELVYVAGLVFPLGTKITRETVQQKLAEMIPEDLAETRWDFQTLRYAKGGENPEGILVQVAVLERSFYRLFHDALAEAPLSIESVIPESYALAQLFRELSGMTVFVERKQETVSCSALESGFVAASDMLFELTPQTLADFLSFLEKEKSRRASRIIFSYFAAEELSSYQLPEAEVLMGEYNPLLGAALQEQIAGRDEEVLNIDVFREEPKRKSWFGRS